MGQEPAGWLQGQVSRVSPRNGIGEKPGGWDPKARVQEMAVDGVSAEVLYPTLGLRLFALEDAELQEACFEIANDWLIDYCNAHPDKLVGVPSVSLYNIDNAIKELERCKKAGLVGCLIWQVPPPHLPFTSDHYNRFCGPGSPDARQPAHPDGIQLQPVRKRRPGSLPHDRQPEAGGCRQHAVRTGLRRRHGQLSGPQVRVRGERDLVDPVLPPRVGTSTSSATPPRRRCRT